MPGILAILLILFSIESALISSLDPLPRPGIDSQGYGYKRISFLGYYHLPGNAVLSTVIN